MGGIFISYRRGDSAGYAGRLSDHLRDHFGRDRVFIDIETIEIGEDFVEALNRAVSSCAVLLAVIGPSWTTMTDAAGRRRLEEPNDFTRLEISAALDRKIRVVPVLVQDAVMPKEEDLPENLKTLTRRQALRLSNESWDYDVNRLCEVLERDLGVAPSSLAKTQKKPEPRRPAPKVEESRKRGYLISGSLLVAAIATGVILYGTRTRHETVLSPGATGSEVHDVGGKGEPSVKPSLTVQPSAPAHKSKKESKTPTSVQIKEQPALAVRETPPEPALPKGAERNKEEPAKPAASQEAEQKTAMAPPPPKAPEQGAPKPGKPSPPLYTLSTSQDRSTVIIVGADGKEKDHISLDPDRVQKVYKAPDGKWSLVLFKVRNQEEYGVVPVDLTQGKRLETVQLPSVPEGVTFGSNEAVISFAAGKAQRISLP